MDTDIRDEIDRSFDEGPPIDDLDLLLDRGRAAVRRRRLAEGASLLLVAGVVTVISLVSTGGSTGSTSPGPAVSPTASFTPSSPPVVPDDRPDLVTPEGEWPGQVDLDLVEFAGGDTEQLQPSGSATILEQRAHPKLPDSFATSQDRSAVAEVRFEGERWYVLARRLPGSPPQYIAVSAKDGGPTLDDFLTMARERYAEGGGGLL